MGSSVSSPPSPEPAARRRVRGLASLLGLYVVALASVVVLDDDAYVGPVLVGVAVHTLYAGRRVLRAWRVSATLGAVRARLAPRYA